MNDIDAMVSAAAFLATLPVVSAVFARTDADVSILTLALLRLEVTDLVVPDLPVWLALANTIVSPSLILLLLLAVRPLWRPDTRPVWLGPFRIGASSTLPLMVVAVSSPEP